MKEVGRVTHYFDKAGAAIVKLSAPLRVGDQIKINYRGVEFEQTVESLQVNREAVTEGKKGEEVGLKVSQLVGEGAVVTQG